MGIQDMIRIVEESTIKRGGTGATTDEINTAESRLRVKFPQSYRVFLAKYGYAQFEGEEVFGLGKDSPEHLNLLIQTDEERQRTFPKLDSDMLPIMQDGSGNLVCLDTSQFYDDECPVIFWDIYVAPSERISIVAKSFDEWMVELAAQRVDSVN